MNKLEITSHAFRRARTHTLVQLSGLISKSGLLETFEISLGLDLQKDSDQKNQVAALFKGLTVLNAMAQSDEVHLPTWSLQGLQLLRESKRKKD